MTEREERIKRIGCFLHDRIENAILYSKAGYPMDTVKTESYTTDEEIEKLLTRELQLLN